MFLKTVITASGDALKQITMLKQIMFSCACLAALSASAQKDTPWWLDPEVNEVNTMPPRAAFFAFETEQLAQEGQKNRSERYLSLEGKWKFNFSKDHDKAPKGFYALDYDDSQWVDFPVPGILEVNGYGDAVYGGGPTSANGVRAVIYLKSGTSAITFTGGEGTSNSPYELQ